MKARTCDTKLNLTKHYGPGEYSLPPGPSSFRTPSPRRELVSSQCCLYTPSPVIQGVAP